MLALAFRPNVVIIIETPAGPVRIMQGKGSRTIAIDAPREWSIRQEHEEPHVKGT